MCLIIDNNVTGDLLGGRDYIDPVRKYIRDGGNLIVSDVLIMEYPYRMQNLVNELLRQKRVHYFRNGKLRVDVEREMVSDDWHVIDLVQRSKARVVCTRDNNLTIDLKNPKIVHNPRCRVYRHQGAKDLLVGCCP